jgi:hypothetical protein
MQKESNFHPQLRRLLLFPLSYASILVRRLGLEPRVFPMCEIYSLGPSPLGRIASILADNVGLDPNSREGTLPLAKEAQHPLRSLSNSGGRLVVSISNGFIRPTVFKTVLRAASVNLPYLGEPSKILTCLAGVAIQHLDTRPSAPNLAGMKGIEPPFSSPVTFTTFVAPFAYIPISWRGRVQSKNF